MGIDIFFLLIAAYGLYFGYTNGVFKVLGTVAAIVGGLLLSMYLTKGTADFISTVFELKIKNLSLISFFVILGILSLLGLLLYRMAKEQIKSRDLGNMEKTMGGVLMAVFFSFLYAVLISFFSTANAIGPNIREKSLTLPVLEKMSEGGLGMIKMFAPFVHAFTGTLNSEKAKEKENVAPDSIEEYPEDEY